MIAAGLGLAHGIREISLQDSIEQQNLVKNMKQERYEAPVQSLANMEAGKCWELRHNRYFYLMKELELGAESDPSLPGAIIDIEGKEGESGYEF